MVRTMKDSGIEWIGKIPIDWKVARQKPFINFIKGKNPDNLNIDSIGIPYVGASSFDTKNYEYYSTDVGLPQCNNDDTLILWDGARAGIVDTGHCGIISSTIIKIVLLKSYNSKYYYWLSKALQQFFIDMANGTTIPHMAKEFVTDNIAPIPPIIEQQAIARYLDHKCNLIDDTIEKQNKVIDKLKLYRQSIITEAVTKGINKNAILKPSGIEWIGDIPEHWEVCRVKYKFHERMEKNQDPNAVLLSLFTHIGVRPRSEMEDRGNKSQTVIDYSVVEKNDIIVNKLLAWMGAIAISEYDGATSPDYDIYTLNSIENDVPKYYHYLFRSNNFKEECYKYGRGIMLMRLRTYPEEFKGIFIPNALKSEQQDIVDYLDSKCVKVDNIIDSKQRLIDKLINYKKSLIYECVTGKKEVI